VWIASSLATVKTPTRMALGNFDGIHRGHRRVIAPILQSANLQSANNDDTEAHPTVVTFHPHPRQFFTGQPLFLLTPLEEKVQLLENLGLAQLILLPFDQAIASLSPAEFVEKILVQTLQAKQISIGENFYFGKGRAGTAQDLQAIAAHFNIQVDIVPLHTDDGDRISSSAIRQALSQGDPVRSRQLLGRPYSLMGEVVQGKQLGRTIGFPTANLKLPPDKFLPRKGVYRIVAWGDDMRWDGVMNLGDRPTVDGTTLTAEVHLFDWTGDLYGKQLTIELISFLRSEQKFSSLDALKAQIQMDCQMARSALPSD
jgi:riboflavin kinase / FMN adenylyltransferase